MFLKQICLSIKCEIFFFLLSEELSPLLLHQLFICLFALVIRGEKLVFVSLANIGLRYQMCVCMYVYIFMYVIGSRRLMPPDALQPKAYCTIPSLQQFLLAPPGFSTRDPSSERRNYLGEKWPVIWIESCYFHAYTFGFFYMPQICDMGQTALVPFRRKAFCGFFRPEKSDGFGRV